MTGKEKLLFYVLVFALTCGITYSVNTNNTQMTQLLIAVAVLLVLMIVIYMGWPIYVFTKSTNMQLVERVLEKRKRVPIYAYNVALVKGDWKEAERLLKQIREFPKAKRMIMQTTLLLVQADVEQAEELLREVPTNNESGAYLHALHCLKKGDRTTFEQHLQTVKSPTRKHVLLAEASFCAGDFESAYRNGERAFFHAKGLECYLMIKFLERSEALGEQRTSYF